MGWHILRWQISNRIVSFTLVEGGMIILEGWSTCLLLIHLLLELIIILVVFFEINDHYGVVVSAIVVGTALIRTLFGDFSQVVPDRTHFVYLISQLLLVVNKEQSIR